MVFDWFRRSAAAAESGSSEPPVVAAAEPGAAPPPADGPAAEHPADAAPAESDLAAAAGPAAAPVAPLGPAVPAAAVPAVGAVDQAALDWARQAYARLKAQQAAAAEASPPAPSVGEAVASIPPAAAAPPPTGQVQPAPAPEQVAPAPLPAATVAASPEPAPPPATAPTATAPTAPPPPAPAPPEAPAAAVALDGPAALAPSVGEVVASIPPAAAAPPPAGQVQPAPAPEQGVPAPLPAAAVAASPEPAPGLSLLERAAAQRQQRLQEITSASPAAAQPAAAQPSVAQPADLPPATAAVESEPQLGAFDDTFTWSAEVLAAQGRRVEDVSLEEIDWLARLRRGLEKTRRNFVSQLLENLGDDPLTPEVLDDLETTLLRADVGVQATDQVLDVLRRRLNQEVVDPAEGLRFLKQQLRDLLDRPVTASSAPLLAPQRDRLNIWLLVGVNGVGKTTTLGKLANLAVRSGYSCLIAAADTFRAAAVQQVQVWGERSGVPVVANTTANADPAAIVFDAIGAARSRGTELVLVDTAGRLQTKHNLMEELSKVRRIIDRLAPEAAVESLLVLDASQGQNGLRQALAFASAAGLTGVVITKLDGSSRGGVALAVASEAQLPIRFIGAGEGIRDLRPFNSFEFVEALLAG